MNAQTNFTAVAALVETFAKANKVSREKLTGFAQDVIATVPASTQVVQAAPAEQTKVVKTRSRNKRAEAHKVVLNFAQQKGGTFTRAELESLGIKSVAFVCATLEETGAIVRQADETKVHAGRGRGSVTYKVADSLIKA